MYTCTYQIQKILKFKPIKTIDDVNIWTSLLLWIYFIHNFFYKWKIIPDPEEETPLQIWLNGNVIAERQIPFYKCSQFTRYDWWQFYVWELIAFHSIFKQELEVNRITSSLCLYLCLSVWLYKPTLRSYWMN